MAYGLGVDLGTTFAAAALERSGRVEVVSLGDRSVAVPSVVLMRADGAVLAGEAAQRRAAAEPDRVAREFKRRLGDPTPLVLDGAPYSATALLGAQLRAVLDKVGGLEGVAPSRLVLTHPANWGPYKRELFGQVPALAGAGPGVRMVTEPEAAAVYYARSERVADGAVVAVYDLGGGTFDVTVLRRTGGGFEILGNPDGIEGLGGIDFDEAVHAHVDRALDGAVRDADRSDPRCLAALARLREDCALAKEALSSDVVASIPVLLPDLQTEVRLTRGELEQIVRPSIGATIQSVRRALDSARVRPEDLSTVLLVGGSSRIPLVAQVVSAELGRPTAVDAHPKHAVALGAALLAVAEPAPPPPHRTMPPMAAPPRPIGPPQPATAPPGTPPTAWTPMPQPAQSAQRAPMPAPRLAAADEEDREGVRRVTTSFLITFSLVLLGLLVLLAVLGVG